MHTPMPVGLAGTFLALPWAIAHSREHKKPAACVDCRLPPRFGYSMRAESAKKDIASRFLNCLKKKLLEDYGKFEARALVIEPAPRLPCYVFQPNGNCNDCKLSIETETLLTSLRSACHSCAAKANFLWVTSIGLCGDNAEKLFVQGISETLLR